MKRLAQYLLGSALLSLAACAASAQDDAGALDACAPPIDLAPVAFAGPVEVGFETQAGDVGFTGELARTSEQTARGLMWRPTIAADYAMVFDFGAPGPRSMWMKNTCAPLDMLFVAENGRVLSIVRGTTPFSLRSVGTDAPARYVVEIAAGRAAEAGIAPGDRLKVETLPAG